MLVNAALFTFSYLLIVVAPALELIYIGRFLNGLATGLVFLVGPIYVAEIASPRNRGFLGSCVQLMVVIGVTLSIVLGLLDSWRWLSMGGLSLSALWTLLLVFVPESPVFTLKRNMTQEARNTLEWLRGSVDVENEFEALQQSQVTSLSYG